MRSDGDLKGRQLASERKSRQTKRLAAIAAMGGCCVHCGFDNPLALEFDHILPVRRGNQPGNRKKQDSDRIYGAIIEGHTENLQLLCANCHAIKTRTVDNADGQLMRNIRALICEAA